MVRAGRPAVGGDPPRTGRRGCRAGGGSGRAGDPGIPPAQAGGHHPRLARRPPQRRCPRQARARGGLHRSPDGKRGVRGRRGPAAGHRAVAGAHRGRWGRHLGPPGGNGRGRPGRVRPPARSDRDVPGRPGPGPWRRARHHRPRPAGDRPCGGDGPPHPSRGIGPPGTRTLGDGDLEAPPAYSVCRRGAAAGGYIADVLGCSITLADIRITGSPGRGAAHLRAGAATGRRPGRASAAGNGGHVRGDEPDRPRAQRPARRHPAPAARPGAGRAHLAAPEPLPLAGRDGADPGSRGRSGRRPRPAGGGVGRVHGRLLPERAADPGVAGTPAGRPGSCGRSLRLGARAGPVG